jgi:hypothetical protein
MSGIPAANGGIQNSATTVGFAIAPQGTSADPATLTELPISPLSVKQLSGRAVQVWPSAQ